MGFLATVEHRHGVFVGTREFKILSRNHAAALLAARQMSDYTGARVTVYNSERRKGERLLADFGFVPNRLRVLKVGASYAEYLRVMAEHKLVFELDTSFVPGRWRATRCSVGFPCVGGNGTVDRLGHPTTCGVGRSTAQLMEIAQRLLCEEEFYTETVAASQQAQRKPCRLRESPRSWSDSSRSCRNAAVVFSTASSLRSRTLRAFAPERVARISAQQRQRRLGRLP
jgi:hypothetical protein